MSRDITPAAFAAFLIVGILGVPASAPAKSSHPWIARRPPVAPPPAHQLRDLRRWPAEPPEPKDIDPARFRLSVEHLCGRSNGGEGKASDESGHALGDLVLAAGAEAGVDPFLLAGLMMEQSGCKSGKKSPKGFGLLRIHPGLYSSPGAPPPPGEKTDWTQSALMDPAENLRLGAKLLSMWQESHAELDAAFGGVPHRGPVAHFIWGDVVRGSGAEDQVLTARRRMIAFYEEKAEPTANKSSLGITLLSPLEGTPRVATSGPGEDRAGGKRRHRGIDLSAAIGEPVRAVADGTIIFAGANLPSAPRRAIPPSQIARYRWRRLGAGGIYICIEHAPERHIVTCYMHLDTYNVSEGDAVEAGQMIGRVGRTGVQLSPPHLHFELRVDDRFMDPTRYLAGLVIPPKATQTYKIVMQAKRMRVAKARNARANDEKL